MKILYKTIQLLTIGRYRAGLEVKTDGTKLYFTVTQKNNTTTAYTGTVTLGITYNGESKTVSWNTSGSVSVTFDYLDSVKTITISGADIMYKNVSYGTSHTFTWGGSYSDPDPTLTLKNPVAFVFGEIYNLTWSVNDPLGREYRVLGVNMVGKVSADKNWINSIQSDYTKTSFSYSVGYSQFSTGAYVSVEVMIGCYNSSADDDERYTGFAEAKTPVYLINSGELAYTPYYISVSALNKGESCTVTWQSIRNDSPYSIKGYELKCGINGGSIDTTLYSGTATSYTYTIGDDVKTIRFALRSLSNFSGYDSPYNLSEWLKVPGGINIYIGFGGEVKEAAGAYLGKGGEVIEIGEVSVG